MSNIMAKVVVKSLLNRRSSVLLTMLSISLSVFILVGIGHIQAQAKSSFSRTVSGVDLIVGARTGELNLLLASVFRIGHFTNGVTWDTYEKVARSKQVKWAIPISLGDSHKGQAVIGTTQDYFSHFAYGDKQTLELANGRPFYHDYEIVLGSTTAKKLNYALGKQLTLSHGTGSVSFSEHDDTFYTVVGILKPTGTPVDEALYVSLSSIEKMHSGVTHDDAHRHKSASAEHEHEHEHEHEAHDAEQTVHPQKISAFLLGLKSKLSVLQIQYALNQNTDEALSAIVPGVALSQLWELLGIVENLLTLVGLAVLITSLLNLCTMLLSSIAQRGRELSIMRTVGATPTTIASLIMIEALIVALVGTGIGLVGLETSLFLLKDWLTTEFGLFISPHIINVNTAVLLGIILTATLVVSLLPTIRMYRKSLQVGLSVN